MDCFLTDYKGAVFALPVLLGWSFSYGDSLPCDAFELSFVYDEGMYEMLRGAVRFSAEHQGRTVFYGVVDEFELSLSEKGSLVTVCGRGLAALLLDNEAEAAELFGASLEFILESYVSPYGIARVERNVTVPPQQMVVSSGASCWRVLEEFLWYGCGERPRFSPDGTLILGRREGRRYGIGGETAVSEQVLRYRRYGVVSQALVKNKSLGTSSLVDNAEFLSRGGCCRRVVNVPRNTRYDAMRRTGQYQIKQSQADEFMLSVTLPSLFAAFPGDIIELDYSPTGASGAFRVGRSCCFASPQGAGTELVLTERE